MKTNTVTITVDPSTIISRPSRYLTGACIEDVNHELYGGIYSQMVFGESFAEPRRLKDVAGFTRYGGEWTIDEGTVRSSGGDGPKLVLNPANKSISSVEVDILVPRGSRGFGGILVNLKEPGIGADSFVGYEVSLDPADQRVIIGRHRKNWEPLCDLKAPIKEGEWNRLSVSIGQSLKISVNGKPAGEFEDTDHLLKGGTVALRPWQCEAEYRSLSVNGKAFPFE